MTDIFEQGMSNEWKTVNFNLNSAFIYEIFKTGESQTIAVIISRYYIIVSILIWSKGYAFTLTSTRRDIFFC